MNRSHRSSPLPQDLQFIAQQCPARVKRNFSLPVNCRSKLMSRFFISRSGTQNQITSASKERDASIGGSCPDFPRQLRPFVLRQRCYGKQSRRSYIPLASTPSPMRCPVFRDRQSQCWASLPSRAGYQALGHRPNLTGGFRNAGSGRNRLNIADMPKSSHRKKQSSCAFFRRGLPWPGVLGHDRSGAGAYRRTRPSRYRPSHRFSRNSRG